MRLLINKVERNFKHLMFVLLAVNKNTMAKGKFNEIINSGEAVLVDFSATWCGPCKALHPILEDVAKAKVPNTRIIKIDVDKNPSTSARFEVRSVPTLIIFKNGEIKWRESGVVPAANILNEMKKYA